MTEQAQTQDLHISQPARPDSNWARMRPTALQPSKERLARSHQLVTIRNTSDVTPGKRGTVLPQKHIVIDRFQRGIELEPGETRQNVDMLVSDIAVFLRQRLPRQNEFGEPMPQHPILIVGVDAAQIESELAADEARLETERDEYAARQARRTPLRRR